MHPRDLRNRDREAYLEILQALDTPEARERGLIRIKSGTRTNDIGLPWARNVPDARLDEAMALEGLVETQAGRARITKKGELFLAFECKNEDFLSAHLPNFAPEARTLDDIYVPVLDYMAKHKSQLDYLAKSEKIPYVAELPSILSAAFDRGLVDCDSWNKGQMNFVLTERGKEYLKAKQAEQFVPAGQPAPEPAPEPAPAPKGDWVTRTQDNNAQLAAYDYLKALPELAAVPNTRIDELAKGVVKAIDAQKTR